MDTIYNQSTDLSTDDFLRIGVRPQEYRLTVIRRAALRAASQVTQTTVAAGLRNPVANLRDTDPGSPSPSDQQLQRELSRVIASAYRVLDPRRRSDAAERAYVGRILPNALLAAGHTNFHPGPFSVEELGSSDEDEAGVLLVGDSVLTDFAGSATWVANTQSPPLEPIQTDEFARITREDLLPTVRSRIDTVRHAIQQPRAILALVVALLLTSGWLIAWQRTLPTPVPTAALATNSTATDGSTRNKTVEADKLPSEVVQPSEPEPAGEPQPASKTGPASETESIESMEQPTIRSLAAESLVQDPVVNRKPPPPWMLVVQSKHSPAMGVDALTTRQLPLIARSTMPPKQPSEDGSAARTRFPIYPVDECANMRVQLLDSLVSVDYFNTLDEVIALQKETEALTTQHPPGSIGHFTASLIASAPLWISASPNDVIQRWQQLAKEYDLTFSEFAVRTFSEASELDYSVIMESQLVERGLMLAHTLLSQEDATATQTVLDLVQLKVARNVRREHTEQLDELYEVLKQFRRTERRVAQRGEIADTTSAEAAIIGRHLCLVSQAWDLGMPWLAAGNDSRLAKLANDELRLQRSTDTTADAWAKLASDWRNYADRIDGRSSHVASLHAVGLLNQAIQLGSALEKLDWTREREALLNALPDCMPQATMLLQKVRDSEQQNATVRPQPTTDSVTVKTSEPMEMAPIYLHGTITMDGFSLPIELRYQAGQVIGPNQLASVHSQLNQWLRTFRLTCQSTLDVHTACNLVAGINATAQGVQQTVYLDNAPVEIDSLEGVGSALLVPGEHSIRWDVDATRVETLFLNLQLLTKPD